jgi:undecaprenyl-diphosphatase
MQQKLSREAAAEFSFFLAVPTMLAVTAYSVIVKDWTVQGQYLKGYEMIFSDNRHLLLFLLGNAVAFIVAVLAIKLFIGMIKKYGFRFWGYYRIAAGILVLILIWAGLIQS